MKKFLPVFLFSALLIPLAFVPGCDSDSSDTYVKGSPFNPDIYTAEWSIRTYLNCMSEGQYYSQYLVTKPTPGTLSYEEDKKNFENGYYLQFRANNADEEFLRSISSDLYTILFHKQGKWEIVREYKEQISGHEVAHAQVKITCNGKSISLTFTMIQKKDGVWKICDINAY